MMYILKVKVTKVQYILLPFRYMGVGDSALGMIRRRGSR